MSSEKTKNLWLPDRLSLLLLLLAILISLFTFFIGYKVAGSFSFKKTEETAIQIEKVKEKLAEKLNQPAYNLWKHIYSTNLKSSLLLIFFGIMTAGLFSVVFLVKLTFPLGMSLAEFQFVNLSLKLYFWSLIPHGIVEFPAFLIIAVVGLRTGFMFIRYLNGGALIKEGDKQQLILLIVLGLILVTIAGVVEAWCTPYFALKHL